MTPKTLSQATKTGGINCRKSHGFPFWGGQREFFTIKDRPRISDWIQEHFRLTTAYAMEGNLKLFPWQIDPVNALEQYAVVIFIAPVQTGKSLLAEAVAAYIIDNDTMNLMFAYAKKETVEDVFDERLKPMVKEIPAIRKYWSGYEDDLTKRRLKLRHCIIRVASAAVSADLATHNAGFVYGSEVAKWPDKPFDAIKMLFGRQQASRMMGKQIKALFETSPLDDKDKSYSIAHRSGTIILEPYQACPHCGHFQVLTDSQVKEIPDSNGVFDHDPGRIRNDGAARYECAHCKQEISNDARIDMAHTVVWAAKNEKIGSDGKVFGRRKTDRVVFNWNRLIDYTWTWAECLASYFEALLSPDPGDLKTYQNEDMARWVKISAKRVADSYLRTKCRKYKQFGADAYVPDGVAVLLIGMDTQDTGYYFVVRGYGKGMESWLVRSDFISCDMNEERFQVSADVHAAVFNEIHRYPYAKKSGQQLPILFGLIDRGGHRALDVDYMVDHSEYLNSYIGSTSKRAPLIERKESGYYYGNTENLSKVVGKQIESSIWHLPSDIQKTYLDQVLNQYDEEYTDNRGNTKTRWVTKTDDHFRDCENALVGATIILELQNQLATADTVVAVQKAMEEKMGNEEKENAGGVEDRDHIKSNHMGGGNVSQWLKGGGWGG